ncbi:probable carboxylesterase 18 [Hordeum vulgare subsp. vulgare]|uniref:Alpha/beta hydrolase fold-3 domain-containing protein n=1 Tax=Hordeum vulgare subsp. vulgare TaxID=112509 RepID=A0A8I6X2Q1_HORVV|nr:probable carboxylesterase 18 [Hordeum vulgare subsp. vulgare]
MEAAAGHGQRPMPAPLPLGVRLQLAGLTAAIDAVERSDGTVNRCLYSVIDRLLSKRANPRPDGSGVRSYDFTVDASRGIWARVFAPVSSAVPLPVVVYYHGGGFALFSPAIGPFNGVCRRLCSDVGAVVVSVNYRLAPEHRYPAAYDDGVDALRFLDEAGVVPGLGDAVPVDLASCFLAGESAGGNIVHHVAKRWAAEQQPSAKSLRLAGIIPVQPYFGGEERTESELRLEGVAPVVNLERSDFSWKAFLPVGATRDHPAAHVTDENAELTKAFPPTLLVVGGFDPLQDWQRRYADVLRRKGVKVKVAEYPDGFHGFYGFPAVADAGKVFQEMKAFVESNMAAPAKSTAR